MFFLSQTLPSLHFFFPTFEDVSNASSSRRSQEGGGTCLPARARSFLLLLLLCLSVELASAAGRGRSHRRRRKARPDARQALLDPAGLRAPDPGGAVYVRCEASPIRAARLRGCLLGRGRGMVVCFLFRWCERGGREESEKDRGEIGAKLVFYFSVSLSVSMYYNVSYKKTALIGHMRTQDREEGETES